MKTLSALLVTPYFYPQNYGGAVVVYKTLIEHSIHTITVYTALSKKQILECKEFDEHAGYSILRIPSMIFALNEGESKVTGIFRLMWHIFGGFYALLRAAKRLKPDVIICGSVAEVGWLVFFVSKILYGIKLVSFVHGEEVTMAVRDSHWDRFLTFGRKKVLEASHRIISVSEFTCQALAQQGVDRSKIAVITNGVDLKRYYPVGKTENLVSRYGLNDCKVLLTLSRLVPKKGVDNVIRSLPILRNKVANLKYLIGGKGPDLDRLKELSITLGVDDIVVFAGFVSDEEVNFFMNLADVFIMPNRAIDGDTEGFGLVFLEANACGIPVIGGQDGGTADAIIDGVTGYRVDGTSIDAIADAIFKLMHDDALRERLGIQASKWVVESQGWPEKVKQFDTLIADVAFKA